MTKVKTALEDMKTTLAGFTDMMSKKRKKREEPRPKRFKIKAEKAGSDDGEVGWFDVMMSNECFLSGAENSGLGVLAKNVRFIITSSVHTHKIALKLPPDCSI